jgi:hypothetical protein
MSVLMKGWPFRRASMSAGTSRVSRLHSRDFGFGWEGTLLGGGLTWAEFEEVLQIGEARLQTLVEFGAFDVAHAWGKMGRHWIVLEDDVTWHKIFRLESQGKNGGKAGCSCARSQDNTSIYVYGIRPLSALEKPIPWCWPWRCPPQSRGLPTQSGNASDMQPRGVTKGRHEVASRDIGDTDRGMSPKRSQAR